VPGFGAGGEAAVAEAVGELGDEFSHQG
jgi:hypothetical protein